MSYCILHSVRNGPEPVLRYTSIRARCLHYLYANSGHLKIKSFRKNKRILENNGPFLSANGV